ncbi:GyrI-like domain-containing protein [Ornithinibacillus bavariensis]|uniref:AraC effector-binding domain-containing protein n=1 Tax=Ornithinibacillus bavariensis TaxID=545502 RepID=A0A919X8J1_9BACI|nr:GyrI-like domain-containing protein [Ornithinibacillus bavariensis]GIO27977.1 hypothetical protein J43TS3_25880 [Ornithinibacillus bavariensis]HAM81074.1 AraC family transcriptional regulator [Ornithinibacillus sp.]
MSEAIPLENLLPIEDFKPQPKPRSLKVLLGKSENRKTEHNYFIKDLEEIRLVGFRVLCEGDKYQEEIPKAANLLHRRTDEIKHVLNSGKQIGAFIVEEFPSEKDGYWVSVQVSKYEDIPKDMVSLTVPPQKYAITLHQGHKHLIRKSHERLQEWLIRKRIKSANDCWNLEFYQQFEINENVPDDLEVVLYNSIY